MKQFTAGYLLGGTLGILVMALCVAAATELDYDYWSE